MEQREAIPLPRRALAQAVLGVCILFLAIFLLGWTMRDPITAWSGGVVEQWGPLGVYALVAVLDPVPGPGHDLGLVVGNAGGLGFWSIWIPASLGSLTGSIACWWLGTKLGNWRPLRLLLDRYGLDRLYGKNPVRSTAIGAIGPFPYLLVTVGAGACGVDLASFALGASSRSLKIAGALLLIRAGWAASA